MRRGVRTRTGVVISQTRVGARRNWDSTWGSEACCGRDAQPASCLLPPPSLAPTPPGSRPSHWALGQGTWPPEPQFPHLENSKTSKCEWVCHPDNSHGQQLSFLCPVLYPPPSLAMVPPYPGHPLLPVSNWSLLSYSNPDPHRPRSRQGLWGPPQATSFCSWGN